MSLVTDHKLSGPKAQPFFQPRATPWGRVTVMSYFGPTGQPFAESTSRDRDGALCRPSRIRRTIGPLGRNLFNMDPITQGVALGWENLGPFGATLWSIFLRAKGGNTSTKRKRVSLG
jgi:hypothetical protein